MSLRGCQSVVDQSLRYSSTKTKLKKKWKILLKVSIGWLSFISNLRYRTLALHCHNIERLDLSDCKKITDHSTSAISKHCHKLLSINLESCVNISDMSLKSISDGCSVSRSFQPFNEQHVNRDALF